MSEDPSVQPKRSWKRSALIMLIALIIAIIPLGLLGLKLSEWAGMPAMEREEAIAALLIEDETGTLRLTSLLLTPENADRRFAGEVGLTLEVARTPGPFVAAREQRSWRTEYAIDPNYGERLPTGNEAWRALLGRFAREHGLAQGDAADYLGRADGSESRLLWGGIIANGAILAFLVVVIVALEVLIMKLAQQRKGRSSA